MNKKVSCRECANASWLLSNFLNKILCVAHKKHYNENKSSDCEDYIEGVLNTEDFINENYPDVIRR